MISNNQQKFNKHDEIINGTHFIYYLIDVEYHEDPICKFIKSNSKIAVLQLIDAHNVLLHITNGDNFLNSELCEQQWIFSHVLEFNNDISDQRIIDCSVKFSINHFNLQKYHFLFNHNISDTEQIINIDIINNSIHN